VTVNFGKAKQAWVGKSPLTKAIMNGAFGIATSLDIGQVQEAAARTCADFPVKNRKLLGTYKPCIQADRPNREREVIAYGSTTRAKTGKDIVITPCWKLGLGSGVQDHQFTIVLLYAKLTSGKIDEVEELEYFLNELERVLRESDPKATVDLVELQNPMHFKKTYF
jgi:hypothetical protein